MESERQVLYRLAPPQRGDPASHPDYMFFCPGCRCGHGLWVARANHRGARWTFNGNMERPTFHPSLLLDTGRPRCHSFVKDGQIQFLPDCTHALAGRIVPMEPF